MRPGLAITINSVTYTLTDPSGLPLDAAGACTTSSVTGNAPVTITRADFELVGPGQSNKIYGDIMQP